MAGRDAENERNTRQGQPDVTGDANRFEVSQLPSDPHGLFKARRRPLTESPL